MSKTVKVDDYGRIDLEVFRCFVDIDKVEFYQLKLNKDKSLILKLYDKKKKLVKPNVKK